MAKPRQKTVVAEAGGSVVHVETPLGVVNIRVGLTDAEGRRVDSIEVLPDSGKAVDGYTNTRIVEPKSGEAKRDLNFDSAKARAALEIVRQLASLWVPSKENPRAQINGGDLVELLSGLLLADGFLVKTDRGELPPGVSPDLLKEMWEGEP